MSEREGLSADKLTVGWNSRAIAQIDNLCVKPGAALVVGGPNGAGKSTLIKTLARQVPRLSGTITLNGRDIDALNARDFARHVAYVPQLVELLQDLTVQELVQLGRNPHQRWWSWQASQSDDEAVQDALERTSAWHLRHHFVSTLSGGERQRACIAMALAQNAKFILLDEPTAHLDFKHQLELVELMQALKQQGIGLLLILHDLNLMARLADEILLVKKSTAGVSVTAAYDRSRAVLTPAVLQSVFDVEIQVFTDPESGQHNFVPCRVFNRHISFSDGAQESLSQ